MNRQKINSIPLYIFIFIFIAVLIIFPEKSSDYAKNGIIIWYKNILPVMLPFLTVAVFSYETGFSDFIAKIFARPFSKFLKVSGYGAFALISAILSGYPAGAKITGKLLSENKISVSEAKKIFALSNVTSPAFIIGAVGVNMFNDKKSGILILISHYVSAVIICMFIKTPEISPYSINKTTHKKPFASALSESAASASQTLITICCFIIIFSIISGMVIDFNLLPSAVFGKDAVLIDYIMLSFIEMTNGCHLLSTLHENYSVSAACAAVSFGGACVYFQILSVLSNTNIKPSYILFTKALHGIISFIIFLILCKII